MPKIQLQCDYLIIGSGAVGMAFADTLAAESDASMIIVDRYAKPGGHWNMAYPFVTLHQPSSFYGVASKELSKGHRDEVGWNKGLGQLASGAEVLAYFDEVMQQTLLPTGRVQYFPLCDYQGNGTFVSKLHGSTYQVQYKKLVDCTFLNTKIPKTHTPNFAIDEGVQFMPLNDLPYVQSPPEGYVVIGGGKTGIDACLWLLSQNVNPDDITWIISRDAWLIDRATTQPDMEFFDQVIGAQAAQFEALAKASSVDNLFELLEEKGALVRIDKNVQPTMFHGATVSQMEMEQLRKIKNVVRKRRVEHISTSTIQLKEGTIPTSTQHIHVDCSATPLENTTIKPIWQDKTITPQTVRSYQPVFSASMIAHLEMIHSDNDTKNGLCQVVPIPDRHTDWINMTRINMMNQFQWGQDPALKQWLRDNRLDGFSKLISQVDRNDESKIAIMKKFKEFGMAAMANIQNLMQEANKQNS